MSMKTLMLTFGFVTSVGVSAFATAVDGSGCEYGIKIANKCDTNLVSSSTVPMGSPSSDQHVKYVWCQKCNAWVPEGRLGDNTTAMASLVTAPAGGNQDGDQ